MHEKARGGSGVDKPGFVEHLCQLGKVSKPPSAWYTVGAPPRKDSSGFRLLFKKRQKPRPAVRSVPGFARPCARVSVCACTPVYVCGSLLLCSW